MEYNFFLSVPGSQRRGKNNRLRWIFSCVGEQNARRLLADNDDEDRHRYIVTARDGTVLQDPRTSTPTEEDEEYDSLQDYQ